VFQSNSLVLHSFQRADRGSVPIGASLDNGYLPNRGQKKISMSQALICGLDSTDGKN